jgi:FkbM family methyltransferase
MTLPGRRHVRLMLNWLALGDLHWARLLTAARVSAREVRVAGADLHLSRLQLTVPKGSAPFMISGYPMALELVTRANARFRCEGQGVLAEVGGIRARLSNEEELFMLREIFVDGVYHVAQRGPRVVWDVGMNIGLAALYFAQVPDTEIVGYEPVSETYRLALDNIARNAHLAGRIRTFNKAIGAADGAGRLYSSTEKPGSSGMFPIPESQAPARSFVMKEAVIERASSALEWISENYPGRSIVAKIDCEGSEYPILRELCESGAIRRIDALVLEWHRRTEQQDPGELRDRLTATGFTVFLLGSVMAASGMLYAVRRA